jgi:hypothetical protein
MSYEDKLNYRYSFQKVVCGIWSRSAGRYMRGTLANQGEKTKEARRGLWYIVAHSMIHA